jgi:hypothetical protein
MNSSRKLVGTLAVMAGRDPAIQKSLKCRVFPWMAASSAAMTIYYSLLRFGGTFLPLDVVPTKVGTQ